MKTHGRSRDRKGASWPIGICGLYAVLLLFAAGACAGQTRLTLEQAASRKAPDFEPAFAGQAAAVQGVVSSPAVRILNYTHIPIEDSSGHGLTLESDEATLSGLHAGDVVDADGYIFNRAGLPVLEVKNLRKTGSVAPPAPRKTRPADVNSFSRLGTTVLVEGIVLTSVENSGGDSLLLGNTGEPSVRVFLPRDQRDRGAALAHIQPGDRVRVVGAGSQYCPFPPYNRSFQLVIGDPGAISVVKRGWIWSAALLLVALAALALSLFIWWFRERSMAAQRRRLRGMTTISEDVIAAATPAEISRKLLNSLPHLIQASRIGLYLFNRGTGSLDRVPTAQDPEPLSISVTSPVGPLSAALALAFRNRAFLYIPNTRKNPVLQPQQPQPDLARSAAFAPLLAQQELLGVLSIEFDETGVFLKSDEQAAVQHLANQIATSLKLQEQHSMRDQLLRSEKMAAAGQLISGVANELRGPLNSIKRSVDNILASYPESTLKTELREIAFEAQRGSEIVGRVVSFAKMDQGESKPLNINSLLASLMEFRESEWTLKGVLARSNFSVTPLIIDGDRSQLEQVMLNLLVHAEQSLFEAQDRQISVTSRSAGKEALIAIDYTDRTPTTGSGDPFSGDRRGDSFGLDVCRAIVQSHGGEIRLLRDLPSGSRFELKLPLRHSPQPVDESATPLQRAHQPMTVLLVEPDVATQRKLLSLLSARGHRAVPVSNAEEAIDLVHRLRFDAVFSSVRLPGVNWVELFERIRRKIGAFILLTEGYDSDLSRAFRGSEGYILSKPIEEKEVERLLSNIEARQESTVRK